MMFGATEINNISLDAAGLVALADLTTIAKRTAIVGSASRLDTLVLAPGIHRHQTASEMNGGEQPATAAMTTGYVFRVENQATVSFLQSIGVTGSLVTVKVEKEKKSHPNITRSKLEQSLWRWYCFKGGVLTSVFYLICPVLTLGALSFFIYIKDWWGIGALLALILAQFINVVVIRQRSNPVWKVLRVLEPGVQGCLLVLISQDRWIRIEGLVDDLKMVTSGQWLRDTTTMESFAAAIATLIVYVISALTGNASKMGSITILCLLLATVSLLGLSNEVRRTFHMHGCVLRVHGEPIRYKRRLELARALVEEFGRSDWAIGLGMVRPQDIQNGRVVEVRPEDKKWDVMSSKPNEKTPVDEITHGSENCH